jgi:hypothetical protein
VPPIGALEERVRGSGAGWIMSDAEWRDDKMMLERVLAILGTANNAARETASGKARAMPHASLRAMTDAAFACYAAAIASKSADARQPSLQPSLHSSLQSFPAARVRDALGYRPWLPPPRDVPPPAVPAPRGLGVRIAQAAVGIRHKLPGRVLYRLAPAALVARLKRHLD